MSCLSSMKQAAQLLTHTTATTTKSLQSCPTLCDPIDGSPPGSAIPRILQARTVEWAVISFFNALGLTNLVSLLFGLKQAVYSQIILKFKKSL